MFIQKLYHDSEYFIHISITYTYISITYRAHFHHTHSCESFVHTNLLIGESESLIDSVLINSRAGSQMPLNSVNSTSLTKAARIAVTFSYLQWLSFYLQWLFLICSDFSYLQWLFLICSDFFLFVVTFSFLQWLF